MNNDALYQNVKKTCFGKPTRVIEFVDPQNKQKYKWTVCTDFFQQKQTKNVDFDKSNNIQLITELNVLPFIHSEEGPAIVNLDNGYMSYWLNGIPTTKEQVERLKYNKDFNTAVDQMINEE